MLPRVYVETTIPSFYYDIRLTPAIVARREWTREWWSDAAERYELVTSLAVISELRRGPPEKQLEWLGLIKNLMALPTEPAVEDIVETYLAHKLMPQKRTGDALHLALASYHKCDFVVTWNCLHLANANKFGANQAREHSPWLVCPSPCHTARNARRSR